jgi:hypothetical protein
MINPRPDRPHPILSEILRNFEMRRLNSDFVPKTPYPYALLAERRRPRNPDPAAKEYHTVVIVLAARNQPPSSAKP